MRLWTLLAGALPRPPIVRPFRPGAPRQVAFAAYLFSLLFASAYMLITVGSALPSARAAAAGKAPDGGYVPVGAALAGALLWVVVAGLAWLFLAMAEPRDAVGLPRASACTVARASLSVFVLAESVGFVASVAWGYVSDHVAYLNAHSGSSSHPGVLADLAGSVAAGFSEEIVVVVLPVCLAYRLRRHVTNPRLRRAGLVVLVAGMLLARLSYHVMYGFGALPLAVWALASILVYLRTRAVLPLMIAHAVYDMILAVIRPVAGSYGRTSGIAVYALIVGVALVMLIATSPVRRSGQRNAASRLRGHPGSAAPMVADLSSTTTSTDPHQRGVGTA
ncbi:hypothetical protein ADK54_41910 [Streptomyces sp. WM6378]|nr:hypothetical protein ADK54_41910 [Streptomyces sp. WM6378]